MALQELIEDRDIEPDSRLIEIATTRQAQEVQAAMVIAKKFPRDEDGATARILKACKRISLAERAMYEYKRGSSMVCGPSIRMAEVMAQNWGNLDFGIIELERRPGESTAMAYCWDLETNTRQTKIFTIRHIRDTKNGGYALKDERDIYEVVANNGARRLRACILGIIPGDVQDLAKEQVYKTLDGDKKESVSDRVRKMLAMYDEIGVTKEDIETKLGHATSAITATQLVKLGQLFNSLRDGMTTREQEFPRATDKSGGSTTSDLDSQIDAAKKSKKSEPKPTIQPDVKLFREAVDACGDDPMAIDAVWEAWCGPNCGIEWPAERKALCLDYKVKAQSKCQ